MEITVFTAPNKPTFTVDKNADRRTINGEVLNRFGAQMFGQVCIPHSWVGSLPQQKTQQ